MKDSSRTWSRQASKRKICIRVERPLLEILESRTSMDAWPEKKTQSRNLSSDTTPIAACVLTKPLSHATIVSFAGGDLPPWQRLKTCHCWSQLIYLEHTQGP